MGQRFVACDREQSFLMPPDVPEWLPEGHLACLSSTPSREWISRRSMAPIGINGRSRPAYDPAMMVALLLYAYARGTRSSRQIERACEEDVAFRVVAALQRPDHATIARFVERHQVAIAGLFGAVLALCAKQGLASVGVIAVDGTSWRATRAATRTSITSSSRARSSRKRKSVDAAEGRALLRGARRRAARAAAHRRRSPRVVARGQAPARAAARGGGRPVAAQPRQATEGSQAAPGPGALDRAARQPRLLALPIGAHEGRAPLQPPA